jgi:hypothetical protein
MRVRIRNPSPERIPGGKASGQPPIEIDPDQIRRGITVEMEHTRDPRVAYEIAVDHLYEIPDYYSRLAAMERAAGLRGLGAPIAAASIAILDRYFETGGDFAGPSSGNHSKAVERAMRDLVHEAKWNKAARRAFAQASIFERTLNPPAIVQTIYVRPSIQVVMLAGLYDSLTGGFWTPPDPSGITEWIGSEAGGRAYFFAALNSPPRVLTLPAGKVEVETHQDVLALLLKIARDAALPAAWFAPLVEQQVMQKLEVRIAGGAYSTSARRVLMALVGQVGARASSELAKLATAQLDAFPAFPTGDGRLTATVPPKAKPWYRNGWILVGAGGAAVGGAALAARR